MASLGGLLTLIPREGASYPNLIGYSSLCTFAPAATFYCFFLAGLSCFIRAVFVKDTNENIPAKVKTHGKSIAILVLILTPALVFTLRYQNIKSYYADTAASATLE
ncbi:MAG: hypothetical protein RQ801_01015 [Spirochaetaceae bacterium]|nr:hypothetical protein [Spirochaetaceae bacterium]MDT8296851.1 hypothetical protein [Spirochaetaceae bacterium]